MENIATISFLVPVRNRDEDLLRLANYFLPQALFNTCEVIVIVEKIDDPPNSPQYVIQTAGATLVQSLPSTTAPSFHKTTLLNQALTIATSSHVVSLDSDLLPLFDLNTLCSLVASSQGLILGGYRIMSGHLNSNTSPFKLYRPTSAPEDCTGAIYKQLTQGERFMVCPVYTTSLLRQLGGWDDQYVGWGCEDQELLERYCQQYSLHPARLMDFLYLHFDHSCQPNWNNEYLTYKNRLRYYNRTC